MRTVLQKALVVIGLIISGTALAAAQTDTTAAFKAALAALSTGHLERFTALASPLHDNILYPYLRYAYLKHEIRQATRPEIDTFLHDNTRLPISDSLRREWLLELARRKDWATFLAEDTGQGGSRIDCARAQALAATGQVNAALSLARRLWLAGYSQPQSCDPVFSLLNAHGVMTPALVQERILLALEAHNPGLARYLARNLQGATRNLADHWLQAYNSPTTLTGGNSVALGTSEERDRVLQAAFLNLARRDPVQARRIWVQFSSTQIALPDYMRERVTRAIALNAAWDNLPQAGAWLASLPPKAVNDDVRIWRVRVALRNGNWLGTLKAIRAMPRWERALGTWQYWEARALDALGQPLEAEKVAAPLSRKFSYYGFLAAEFLQRPYATGNPLPTSDPTLQRQVSRRYLIRVALALEAAAQHSDAKAAWLAALRPLHRSERLAAAELAYRDGWAYGAYAAAARAGLRNASRLMFPFEHMHYIHAAASSNGLGPGLILAVMRQESAFQASVCSDKGACGLLQLLPETACWIGRQAGFGGQACDSQALSQPAVNIRAGASYLAYLLKQFGNDAALALAAYNAGPSTVTRWLSSPAAAAAKPGSARWVATLPYGETRQYVESVLFNRVVYEKRLSPHTAVATATPRYVTTEDTPRLADTILPRSPNAAPGTPH
ncbi:hypothetical protein BJI67_05595 [Acidihalobacter aeolianus]|uniref:Transglycosylase SLT domain-containing protein n=1 Tax=Acidihalobacter aeolianus TaxID=2792603 RepID=A0A1D8K6S3_9GAMM|nr:transglycosylase SLT domain-containing protein [Acidihalobacter aeolianus]AOV16610.1 hypothetical protein BJI67_05595 [Acidihalobacter aeolianus]